MVDGFFTVLILDGLFLIAGIVLAILKNKHNIDQRIVDAPWEMIKIITAAYVGYQFGGQVIGG